MARELFLPSLYGVGQDILSSFVNYLNGCKFSPWDIILVFVLILLLVLRYQNSMKAVTMAPGVELPRNTHEPLILEIDGHDLNQIYFEIYNEENDIVCLFDFV